MHKVSITSYRNSTREEELLQVLFTRNSTRGIEWLHWRPPKVTLKGILEHPKGLSGPPLLGRPLYLGNYSS